MTSEKPEFDDEEVPGGPFPTWGSLYTTLIVFALASIVVLYILSVSFDFSAP